VIRMAELGKLAAGLTFLSNVGLRFLKSLPPNNGNGNVLKKEISPKE